MNQSYPVPPPELVQQWAKHILTPEEGNLTLDLDWFARQAAQWGADQELEACVEWLGDAPVVYNDNDDLHPGSYLRDDRRPKPPSLKEQALKQLRILDQYGALACKTDKIRRALEALDG